MNGNATDVVAHHFALTSMQPCANIDPEWAYFLRNRTSAADTARRAIERSEYSIAGRLDLSASKSTEITPDGDVMIIKQFTPAVITERSSLLSRRDNVGKENGSEGAVDFDRCSRTGQKLLDGISDLHGIVADERYVVFCRKLDIARGFKISLRCNGLEPGN